MTDEILTRCGYRCDLCLAYRLNIKKNDRRQMLSDGWHMYYGFRISPDNIICDGCMSGENPTLIDASCPVRPCVMAQSYENCAHCGDYVCDKLKERIADYDEIQKRHGKPIPERDYENFIKPYESKERLEKIRRELRE